MTAMTCANGGALAARARSALDSFGADGGRIRATDFFLFASFCNSLQERMLRSQNQNAEIASERTKTKGNEKFLSSIVIKNDLYSAGKSSGVSSSRLVRSRAPCMMRSMPSV